MADNYSRVIRSPLDVTEMGTLAGTGEVSGILGTFQRSDTRILDG